MKMKTRELTGKALDCAVNMATQNVLAPVAYSTEWRFGGPIIERERITIDAGQHGWLWVARKVAHETTGPTPLVAAMRCYVASKLGDEVDLPEELADAAS